MTRYWFIAVIALCSIGRPNAVLAEDDVQNVRDEEARQLFQAGRLAFSDGRFEDALSYFNRAYELSQRAQLLYNIGTAADRLRRNREALEAFELYLQKLPTAENRREVESRVRLLRAEEARAAAAPAPVVPTPAQTAAAQENSSASHALDPQATTTQADKPSGSVFKTWWFWTIAGVVVAGAVVGTVLATQSKKTEPLLTGDGGTVAFTLESR